MPPLSIGWQVRLLGGIEVRCGDLVIRNFPNRAVALLLARLAMAPQQSHAREQLIELIWPDAPPTVGRARFRPILSYLRSLLEPAGRAAGTVLQADRLTIALRPEAVRCDVVEFERLLSAGRAREAHASYGGELMPGFYEDWVVDARSRLEDLLERAEVDGQQVIEPQPEGHPGRRRPTLPAGLGAFFGRESELVFLRDALTRSRLVTISGAAGCGKTRLALELARGFEQQAYVGFVGLAECGSPSLVIEHARAALNLTAGGARDEKQILDQLADALHGSPSLLVLDNFEHLVDDGVASILAMLDRIPLLRILVTSRRALQRAGEIDFALTPLPLPSTEPGEPLASIANNPSVALFVERAREALRRFPFGERNAAEIVRLCHVLEGLPLALELAAAKVRAYSVAEMCVILRGDHDLLARRIRRANQGQRHDSLRAALDWSWHLLDAAQQRLLVSLTVFRGGWNTAAVQAVCGDAGARDLLDGLVAESLVQVQVDDGGVQRFAVLESVRVHARQQLEPAESLALRTRHRRHYLARAISTASSPSSVLDTDLGNIVAAIESALDDDDVDDAVRLCLALQSPLEARGATPQLCALFERVARECAHATSGYSSLLCTLSRLLLSAGDSVRARASASVALERATETRELLPLAEALFRRARVEWVLTLNVEHVLPMAQECLLLARSGGSKDLEGHMLALLGAVALHALKNPRRADALYARAETLHSETGNAWATMLARDGRIACLMFDGHLNEAIALGLACEREAAERRIPEAQMILLSHVSFACMRARRWDEALTVNQREVALARSQHSAYHISFAIWNRCVLLARLRRPREAARMMAFAQRYWLERFGPIAPSDARHIEKIRRMVCLQAGARAWEEEWARGLSWTLGEGLDAGCVA